MASAKRRALVVRIGALGDVLLTRRLTYSLFNAGLQSTLFAPASHASLLRTDPWIDGVLDSESPAFAGVFAGQWPETGIRFDLCLVISGSTDLMRAARMAAARVIQIPPLPSREDISIAQQWAEAASDLCSPFTGPLPGLETDPGRALMAGATLVHPGSGSARKNWPAVRFLDLSRGLARRGHRVAWIRGPAEEGLPPGASAFEILDRPALGSLAATLAQSRLYIGNDSGVSHLAAAVGAQTVVLFGPTSGAVWRPDGARVETVLAPSGALDAISAEDVMTVAETLARLG
jgi:ADP-heptose:LPS heptosyltransferase